MPADRRPTIDVEGQIMFLQGQVAALEMAVTHLVMAQSAPTSVGIINVLNNCLERPPTDDTIAFFGSDFENFKEGFAAQLFRTSHTTQKSLGQKLRSLSDQLEVGGGNSP